MKKCLACGLEKPISEFYKHPKMADGHLNRCAECVKQRARQHRVDNIDRYRQRDADRYQRSPNRRKHAAKCAASPSGVAARKRWQARNPLKRKAHCAVSNALRDGRITKKPCEVCGATRVHGHHDDYTRPLDVRWLCPTHHAQAHRQD